MSTANSSPTPATSQGTKLRICLVALNAYPVIDSTVQGTFGGIETRSWIFAKALASLPDVEVHFVVRHFRNLNQQVYAGVRLHLWLDRLYPLRESVLSRVSFTSRFPWLRVLKPSWSLLWELPLLACSKILRGGRRDPLTPNSLLKGIPADLFLTFGVQSNSATVIATAHAMNKPAALFLGSDGDLDERYARQENFVSVYRDRADVCQWLLRNADLILAQTEQQRHLLKERFKRDSKVISNPIDHETWDELARCPIENPVIRDLDRYALWIGRADSVHKRPQLCVELARLCPEVHFLMIMNPRDDVVEEQVRSTAPANVTIVSSVPFEQIPAVFSKAAVLVNTSSLEGFPNTYLQAALSRVPIASLVVEPAFLTQTRSGHCANGDLEKMSGYIRDTWLGDRQTDPEYAREEIISRHGLHASTKKLNQALLELLNSRQVS